MKLIFATNNLHKFNEVAKELDEKYELLSLKDLNIAEEIPETETTLEGNAAQKARFIYEKYGYNCFSDDTGLEIKTLNDRPGVYSARYAGEKCTFDDNMNKVLDELEGVSNREARFRTVIALIINGEIFYFEGIVEGTINRQKRGELGFGYDPIFQPAGYDLTFAEMPLSDKNKISHRGIAIKKLVSFLNSRGNI
jgi:XTP/dITP diphosphohydrolase